VVIAIIAVLAAIIFPVFSQVRRKARQAQCASNLRQLGMAIEMYGSDSDELYPFGADAADLLHPEIWVDHPQWQSWIPYMPYIKDIVDPYVRSKEMWHCPSDAGFDALEDFELPMNARPTSFAAFGASYHYRTEITFTFTMLDGMDFPAETNVLFDAHGSWHGGLLRDRRRYNMLYADGHVKSVDRRGWSEAWATPLHSGVPNGPPQ